MDDDVVPFGEVLRRLRVAAALSQEELAERAGVSARGISDLERGVRQAPRPETLRLVVGALALGDRDRELLVAAAYAERREASKPGQTPSMPQLPLPAGPLFGRDEERAALCALLTRADVQLVTVTGVGGTGKTHLALAVASQLRDVFRDGVIFVDLAPIVDPAHVMPSIASALGIDEAQGRPILETLIAGLRDKQVLILLDNCEQVLAAAPQIGRLLASCAELTVLATSREALRIRGEREWPLLPLPLPDLERLPPLADLQRFPSVALFAARAEARDPRFALTAENAQAIATICHRVDGLPLAIELAAARIKLLSPGELASRLDQRLPLLAGGARDGPARQRTLRDAIAWSYDLLDPQEQVHFRRLAVFVGGWTVQAAEAVVDPYGDLNVLDGLTSLHDKSLVRVDARGAASRYSMLETIREFALERWQAASDEHAAVQRAHATFFAHLAISSEHDLSAGVQDAVTRVATEQGNLRAALRWLLVAGEGDTARRMAGSLSEYWTFSGWQFAEGRAWLEQALAQSSGASAAAKSLALYGLASIAQQQGDYATTRRAAAEGFALAQAHDDMQAMVRTTYLLSLAERNDGNVEAALAHAEEGARRAEILGDRPWLAWSLERLGHEQWYHGDREGATRHLSEARELFQACGGLWGEAYTVEGLAGLAMEAGDVGQAARLYAEALGLRQATGAASGAVDILAGVASVARAMGQLQAATRLLGACAGLEQQLGVMPFVRVREVTRRSRETLQEELGEASFTAAWTSGEALTLDEAIAEALTIVESAAR